jgi:hypothetical protein
MTVVEIALDHLQPKKFFGKVKSAVTPFLINSLLLADPTLLGIVLACEVYSPIEDFQVKDNAPLHLPAKASEAHCIGIHLKRLTHYILGLVTERNSVLGT